MLSVAEVMVALTAAWTDNHPSRPVIAAAGHRVVNVEHRPALLELLLPGEKRRRIHFVLGHQVGYELPRLQALFGVVPHFFGLDVDDVAFDLLIHEKAVDCPCVSRIEAGLDNATRGVPLRAFDGLLLKLFPGLGRFSRVKTCFTV